ncbi:NAD-dependent protein deacylase [Mycoplasma sp. P36-A1]|uniref:NAD-dependent protein deacylase n=1 Tax=Mycoplasma sp. P36-A1 TaxID=3252900 RepID=UPI003C2F2A8F
MENDKLFCQGKIKQLHDLIEKSKNIVALTGAGISVESGIPDFASSKGLIEGKKVYPTQLVLSHNFFYEHPDLFYKFYNQYLVNPNAQPNAAHTYLAELEKTGKLKGVITQNIDDLHQKAGSKNVITLHGSTNYYTCYHCNNHYTMSELSFNGILKCPNCNHLLKPDVVLYGENLNNDDLKNAINLLINADLLLVIGTALQVYPAAGLIDYFNKNLVEINLKPTTIDNSLTLGVYEKAGTVFKLLKELD